MSDSKVFFEELQGEFLVEADFMMEQFEESMLRLESGENMKEDLTQIFRVAHSIKGGASAVGFTDLSGFAHVMEDLLAVLRVNSELANSDVISILLESGDLLKKRITSLKANTGEEWDTSTVTEKLKMSLRKLNGQSEEAESKEASRANESPSSPPEDDVTNYELLAELEQKFGIISEENHPDEVKSSEKTVFNEAEKLLPLNDVAVEKQNAGEHNNGNHEFSEHKNENKEPIKIVAAKTVDASVVKETPKANFSVKQAPVGAQKPQSSSKSQPQQAQIKVDTTRIDSVLDAVGEIVVLKNQLIHDEALKQELNAHLASIVDLLDKSVRDLYDKALGMRMTPLKSLFLKTQRIVRDVSLQLNKPVNLKIMGEDTEVERTVFEILGDPMTHLVRNALDHGIEKDDIRRARGKNPVANVTVSAKQKGGHVVIDIIDDGGGIDREKISKKIREKNLIGHDVNLSNLSDEEIFQFLFAPGFSTAEKVTDLSGRGVGLDVVKSNLEKIQGKIQISSKLGEGTTFSLIIPLSTAITDGIVVVIKGNNFILPIHSIKEIVMVTPRDYTHLSEKHKMVKIREFLMPVINLDEFLSTIPNITLCTDDEVNGMHKRLGFTLVIIETPLGFVAMPVDNVIGQTQVVVKPFNVGHSIPEISGAAVLGDGSTVLIFDPVALASAEMKSHQSHHGINEVAA